MLALLCCSSRDDYDEKEDLISPDPTILVVRARYDFEAEDEDDLQFDPGDLVLVKSPDVKDSDFGDESKEGQWLQVSRELTA